MTGYYFSDAWVQERTGLHRTAVAKMRRDRRMRPEILRLAEIELYGNLGLVHTAWQDWRMDRAGALWTPGGESFTAGQIMAIPLRYQYMRALAVERDQLRTRVQALEALTRPATQLDQLPAFDVQVQSIDMGPNWGLPQPARDVQRLRAV